jgi:hypothetical protein
MASLRTGTTWSDTGTAASSNTSDVIPRFDIPPPRPYTSPAPSLQKVHPQQEHNFLLTEPPMNTPENRELTAEIMFETFNVNGLYIAVQAVLALAASWTSKQVVERTLTGTVVDAGDGDVLLTNPTTRPHAHFRTSRRHAYYPCGGWLCYRFVHQAHTSCRA